MDNQKAALISVSDKSGIVEFAGKLVEMGYQILTTGGTGKALQEGGVPFLSVEKYTGQKEILNGRVKTLHPKIHAGILADMENADHVKQLQDDDILPIELVVVNLYPFTQHLVSEVAKNPAKMVELIDIGGPTMIRAAAKNFRSVYPIIDPDDYPKVLAELESGKSAQKLKLKLMQKVFSQLAQYNLAIAKYFSHADIESDDFSIATETEFHCGETDGIVCSRVQELRYGENPHQKGAYYEPIGQEQGAWKQLGGKELSYNNLLDFDAAARIARSLPQTKPAVAIIKHLNPCGAACADTLSEALALAKRCDPRSHFGGVIAFNTEVDAETAKAVVKDFTEIVVAPAFAKNAFEVLKKKKNLRLIELDVNKQPRFEMRGVLGGMLVQEMDPGVSDVREAKSVADRKPSETELQDLQLAWSVCAHVKSNAITIVKDSVLLGVGAGQMSRIDACELALAKVKTHDHNIEGGVAASDAFFPFPDCLEHLHAAGVTAVVVPGGSRADEEVIAKAKELGMSLLFVEDRHFRH